MALSFQLFDFNEFRNLKIQLYGLESGENIECAVHPRKIDSNIKETWNWRYVDIYCNWNAERALKTDDEYMFHTNYISYKIR